ncbi:MAG: amino acid ABC transporter substrate-binding protein [Rhodospirillales bacterium]
MVRIPSSALCVFLLASTVVVDTARAGELVEAIRARHVVRCSVDMTPGFGGVDEKGRWQGFDVDYCRALAAAILGDAGAVEPKRISTRNKFEALARSEIDVVLGMTTWTLGRDAGLGGHFVGVTYHDGQGFLAWADSGIKDLGDLADRKLCVQEGTTSADNAREVLARNGIKAVFVVQRSSDERRAAFLRRDCEVTTGDRSGLAAFAASSVGDRGLTYLLAEVISREPLGPMVSDKDPALFTIARWVLFAQILAEEKGITSANVAETARSPDPEVRRLFGHDDHLHEALGLEPDWARNVIAQVGNYGEVFERNLGVRSPIGLERGFNALASRGGLMTAPPVR